MAHQKFDISKLERLNDPARLESMPPEVMWRALGYPTPAAIADIGAGTGLFACRFAELAPAAEIYAIDIEPAMVRWMLTHRPLHLCQRLHPRLGRESALPLGAGEIDLALMVNLHHELVDPRVSYAEAYRVLRPDGQLLVVDWRPGNTDGGPPQHVRASADEIASTLEDAGFEGVVSHAGLSDHSLITARKP